MNVKIELNDSPSDNLRQSAQRHIDAGAGESLEEAFERILGGKNISDTDRRRILAVRESLIDGSIARESKAYNKEGVLKRLGKAEVIRLYKLIEREILEQKQLDMVANTPSNYELVMNEDRLAEIVEDILRNETVIAVDTETTGVDVYTDVIVGFSITMPKMGRHVYVPTDHSKETLREGERNVPTDKALSIINPVLESDKVGKVMHNAKFDLAMFRRHGKDVKGIEWDTEIAMHLLNENEPSFRLKDLAPKYLGVESDTFGELFGNDFPFRDVPLDLALVYAAKDTHITWDLYEFQLQHLERFPTILEYYRNVEAPLTYVLTDMEANGYVIDTEFAKEYGEQLQKRSEELLGNVIKTLAPYSSEGENINLNSTAQLKEAVSGLIGEELPNAQAKTVERFAKKHSILNDYLEYKSISKLYGTYIDALPARQNPTTKKWHSRFNARGTVTGRFSSGKDEDAKASTQGFNVQNQPQEARPMFVAPEGKVLIGADFKAQEVRCAAYLSGERVLIDGFNNGVDPYAQMASNFYGKSIEECHKLPNGDDTPERKTFKVVWLAMTYGMSHVSLARDLGIVKEEAKKFQEGVFKSMPQLSQWLKDNETFVKRYGYVWTDKNQRKRRLPNATKQRYQIPYGKYMSPEYEKQRIHNAQINGALRQGTNARVQGSSSIQTKVTMIKAHEYCKQREGWELWGSIHDELIFEVPEDFTLEDTKEIERLMTESYTWGDEVPNGTDLEVMKRWGRGMTPEDWFKNKRNGDE